jgi:PadR family transcriptional regulator PadR
MQAKENGTGMARVSEWTSQLRRGVLELCVLQVLRTEPSENTVYPLLRRLRADGLLDTFMRESPNGPPRQYYRLTSDGRKRLAAFSKEWDAMAAAVAQCMNEEWHHERDASRR